MDFSAICRTCIKSSSIDLNPIFLSEDAHEKFSSAFYACTGVQAKFNDGLPQNMCTACMSQFNNTLKFRKQCKQAETYLLKIKIELKTENSTANDELNKNITNHPQKTKKQAILNKSESDMKETKSGYNDFNIKDEPEDIHNEEHKILTTKSNNIEINSSQNYNADISDIESLMEQTILYKNENNFNIVELNRDNTETDNKYTQNNIEQDVIEITPSDNEDTDPIEISDSNTESQNVDVPYIISDADTKTTRVVCKLCQKELSIRSIDSHMMRSHPGADKRKVKCELCDKYLMREKLNRHRVMMHGNVGVRCGYCKSEFKSQEALVDHVATCSAKRKKRKANDSGRTLAECDICKMTMQRASLIKHKAVKHAGLRPVCEHCGKAFGNKFRLNEHYRAKHGYEKFQCSYINCDFRSAGIMALRNHERRHRDEKPYVCETCGAKFHAAYILMQHKHSHRTEKLVKCDLCPASFKANNNLHMHKLTCHSKSVYSCSLCSRTYKCRHYAVKHARMAHHGCTASDVIQLMAP